MFPGRLSDEVTRQKPDYFSATLNIMYGPPRPDTSSGDNPFAHVRLSSSGVLDSSDDEDLGEAPPPPPESSLPSDDEGSEGEGYLGNVTPLPKLVVSDTSEPPPASRQPAAGDAVIRAAPAAVPATAVPLPRKPGDRKCVSSPRSPSLLLSLPGTLS